MYDVTGIAQAADVFRVGSAAEGCFEREAFAGALELANLSEHDPPDSDGGRFGCAIVGIVRAAGPPPGPLADYQEGELVTAAACRRVRRRS